MENFKSAYRIECKRLVKVGIEDGQDAARSYNFRSLLFVQSFSVILMTAQRLLETKVSFIENRGSGFSIEVQEHRQRGHGSLVTSWNHSKNRACMERTFHSN